MNKNQQETHTSSTDTMERFILGLWGIRYQVKDVARAVAFYERLGFKLDHKALPAFAQVSAGDLKLILSGPGASGSRPMPDGQTQEPGGWTRVILQVSDLPAGSNSSTGLPSASSNRICLPPGPTSI